MSRLNPCGGCTLCCDLLEVGFFCKPANTHCQHCIVGIGCTIWETRPAVCRHYMCLWHANPKFPDSLRPDRCGALFEPVRNEKIIIVNVDPNRPTVWNSLGSPVALLIRQFLIEGTAVVVIIGTEKHFILPEGMVEKEVRDGLLREAKRLELVA